MFSPFERVNTLEQERTVKGHYISRPCIPERGEINQDRPPLGRRPYARHLQAQHNVDGPLFRLSAFRHYRSNETCRGKWAESLERRGKGRHPSVLGSAVATGNQSRTPWKKPLALVAVGVVDYPHSWRRPQFKQHVRESQSTYSGGDLKCTKMAQIPPEGVKFLDGER